MYILFVLILLALIAFFTSSEIALISANRVRLRAWGRRGRRRASFASEFLKKPHRFLSTILVGTNLSQVALTVVFSRWLILRFGRGGEVGATFIVTFLILVVGEIIPKSIASKIPEAMTIAVARPLDVLHTLFLPFSFLVNSLSKALLFLLGGRKTKRGLSFTREELSTAVREGEKIGILNSTEKEMVSRIFTFSRMKVRDVMVPRAKIFAAPVNSTQDHLVSLISKSGHSRIPIYDGNLDNIVGIVHTQDLIALKRWDIRKAMRPVKFVHLSKPCDLLLNELTREFSHLAMVTDTPRRLAGMVTLEDLVEVMVGEIRDEHDKPPS